MDAPIIEDDPVLGKFIANYPSDRLRLLMFAGGILAVVWFVVTVSLWQVEENVASFATVVILAGATLVIGWFVSHLWNREVILFEQGFTYREGSLEAFFFYHEVDSMLQQGEIISYFGGRIRRSTYKLTIIANEDEQIVLTRLYRRIDELGLRLENAVTRALRPGYEERLKKGETVRFGDHIAMTSAGLQQGTQQLDWADYQGYQVKNRQLQILSTGDMVWFAEDLGNIDHVRLLIDLLRQTEEQA